MRRPYSGGIIYFHGNLILADGYFQRRQRVFFLAAAILAATQGETPALPVCQSYELNTKPGPFYQQLA